MSNLTNILFRNWLILVMLFSYNLIIAQTGIGTTTPNASAKLDVYSTNKGFLPPRVTLTSASDATTIASPAEGLLVYNLGTAGLQAGYYYWNGANWATIATATSAGNGVTAMDMVKLYNKTYSTAIGDIANANGYSFTVPVSGRYLFDFSSSGYMNQAVMAITFKVRQGTTDLASDVFSNANNNVHVVFNGMVEVNLQAGVTYNVYVTSTGSRDGGDYDRVYYKLIAGNLPVTGQTVEYGLAKFTGSDGGSLSNEALISFDATAAGNLVWSGNKFTLKANKTYELESSLAIYLSSSSVSGRFQIYDYTNSTALASGLFMSQNGSGTYNPSANSPMKAVVTPATDIQVGIRMLDYYGPAGPGIIGSTSYLGTAAAPNASYFMVKQIGSSAIVNPWVLSGTDAYNTTGKVGIGTSTPSTTLDVNGTAKATSLNLTNSTIGTPSLVLRNGDAAASFSDVAQIKMGWSGSVAGKSQYAQFLHTRHNSGSGGNAIDFYLSDGTADNTVATGSTKAMSIESPGNLTVAGNINLADASGNVVKKVAGFVNAGDYITLDNLKVRVAPSGYRSLQVATVSGTYTVYGSDIFSANGTGGTTIFENNKLTITTTPVYLNSGLHFAWGGYTDTWTIMDTTNFLAWRISCILGHTNGAYANFISIERLL